MAIDVITKWNLFAF